MLVWLVLFDYSQSLYRQLGHTCHAGLVSQHTVCVCVCVCVCAIILDWSYLPCWFYYCLCILHAWSTICNCQTGLATPGHCTANWSYWFGDLTILLPMIMSVCRCVHTPVQAILQCTYWCCTSNWSYLSYLLVWPHSHSLSYDCVLAPYLSYWFCKSMYL